MKGPTTVRRAGDAEKHHDGAVDAHEVGVVQNTDQAAQSASGNRGDLVDHEAARGVQAIYGRLLDLQPEQWGVGDVGEKRYGIPVTILAL
jgi:hypothetical protein